MILTISSKKNLKMLIILKNLKTIIRSPHRHSKINIMMKMNVCKVSSCSLSDGESMINVISLLNPKQMVVINGDEREDFVMEVN